ncbi:ceroid-lipofuscinosis neuronal protein 5 isoform X2 [Salvelinus namaycush]|uniref:Bis(monoacylglycero)phosphate synthase CLN5 n=1 Tax=Salvelinus namaycush TaxID=8040 RepID=A0A8U1F7N0_SALNM|nr:ceroid-lipofuscinosis neuronal protein 5 isoform X2 [Salvelinus namaycush]
MRPTVVLTCSVLFYYLEIVHSRGVHGKQEWPIPYRRFDYRPAADSYCEAMFPFCPTGDRDGRIPYMNNWDIISLFRMQAPVWEFKYGSLLGKMGAACFFEGIDDVHWSENGTLEKVGEISGGQFNEMALWVQGDNQTGIYYETWTVRSDPGPNATVWFDSYDCSQFVHRTYRYLTQQGAKLSSRSQTNYTKIYLYSGEPTYLGDDDSIFRVPSAKTLADDIRKFYHPFRPHQSYMDFVLSLAEAYQKVVEEKSFYLYYNFEYWHLPMKSPYVQITYEEVPLP